MQVLAISVDPSVASFLALGVLVFEDIVMGEADAAVASNEIAAMEADIRSRMAEAPAREAFRAEARKLYKAFGIDPTKHRPSSEQLMLRVVKGDPFPRVNPVVDAVNQCQLAFGLPYGLYDLAALEPPITARAGRAGESYAGIRKGDVHVEGRPCLVDARGPFGNPSSDSDRAKTSLSTTKTLCTIFASPQMTQERWSAVLEGTRRLFAKHVQARVVEQRVVKG